MAGRPSIYIASKAVHGGRWRRLRALGIQIVSTWIDEAEPGATSDWPDLWQRCVSEAAAADVLIVYHEPGETLKGAWVEVGAALAARRRVIYVGPDGYSVLHHPLIERATNLDEAFAKLREPSDA